HGASSGDHHTLIVQRSLHCVEAARQAFGSPRPQRGGAFVPPPETDNPRRPCGFRGFLFCPFQDGASVPAAWNFLAISTVYGSTFQLIILSAGDLASAGPLPAFTLGGVVWCARRRNFRLPSSGIVRSPRDGQRYARGVCSRRRADPWASR